MHHVVKLHICKQRAETYFLVNLLTKLEVSKGTSFPRHIIAVCYQGIVEVVLGSYVHIETVVHF